MLNDPREIPNPYDETARPFVGGGEFNYMYIDKVTGKPRWASAAEEQELKDEYKKKFGEYAHDELRRTHIRTNEAPAETESAETTGTSETTEGAEGI